jgi:hypothetical protein
MAVRLSALRAGRALFPQEDPTIWLEKKDIGANEELNLDHRLNIRMTE